MLKRGKSNATGPLESMPRPDEIPMATANDQCSGRIVGHHRSKSVGSPERKSPIAKMSSDNVVQKHKGASGVPVRPTTAVKNNWTWQVIPRSRRAVAGSENQAGMSKNGSNGQARGTDSAGKFCATRQREAEQLNPVHQRRLVSSQ